MAYTEGILQRLADSIEDERLQIEFRERLEQVEFDDSTGVRCCVSVEVERAFAGSPASFLLSYLDFRGRDLWDEADFANQKPGTLKWQRPSNIYGAEPWKLSPQLTADMFPDVEDGDVVAEGNMNFAFAGFIPGVGDCTFLETDEGNIYVDNNIFWGRGGRCRLIKRDGRLEVLQLIPAGMEVVRALESKLETDGHGDARKKRMWLESFFVQSKRWFMSDEVKEALWEIYDRHGWNTHAEKIRYS